MATHNDPVPKLAGFRPQLQPSEALNLPRLPEMGIRPPQLPALDHKQPSTQAGETREDVPGPSTRTEGDISESGEECSETEKQGSRKQCRWKGEERVLLQVSVWSGKAWRDIYKSFPNRSKTSVYGQWKYYLEPFEKEEQREHALAKTVVEPPWSAAETNRLVELLGSYEDSCGNSFANDGKWTYIAGEMKSRLAQPCKDYANILRRLYARKVDYVVHLFDKFGVKP